MGYRGEDLDLRTPQTWSATPADLAGSTHGEAGARLRSQLATQQRAGPIWVDETVLAACNHAFDVALAHRAGEVGLEHLLHALTRIDASAEALEARGIRVTALRRETGAIIASEIPVGLPNGKGTPRRSDELEEALRIAAASAARRDAPADVEDVLRAMIELRPDLPGLQIAPRLSPRYPGTLHEPLPLLARHAYGFENGETARRMSHQAERMVRADVGRPEHAAASTDAVQSARIEALEQMVRALTSDLASDRKAMTSVLQELQREVMAQRDDISRYSGTLPDRLPSDLSDRMQSIERAVLSTRPPQPLDLAPLLERMAQLERAIMGRAPGQVDLAPLVARLEIIEEAVLSNEPAAISRLAERVKALEEQLASERARAAEAQAALADQINRLSALVESQKSEISSSVLAPLSQSLDAISATLSGRFGALETSLSEATRKAEEMQASHVRELKEVHVALMKLNANQHTLAGSLAEWRTTATGEIAGTKEKIESVLGHVDGVGATLNGVGSSLSLLGERLGSLEKESTKPLQMLEVVSSTLEKMHKVTVERYYRRNRFWYWLFGTDDWVAASWPSQAARIIDDLKSVKGAPSRK